MKIFFNWVNTLDRRIIFLMVALAAILPLIRPLDLPVRITPNSQNVYNLIDTMTAGDTLLISFDYDPASAPELQPMAKAIVRQCFKKGIKIVAVALWPQGPMMAKNAFADLTATLDFSDKKYGVDYVNLGYKPSPVAVVQGIGESFESVFPNDFLGNPTKNLELMKTVKNYNSVKAVFSLTTGSVGIGTYITLANAQYRVKVIGGCTAISSLEYYPYIQSKQLLGLVEGLKGASEYEKLVKKAGLATAGMDVQAVVHMLLIFFIALANVSQMYIGNKK